MQTSMEFDLGHWRMVKRTDPRARELADRHYSRQSIGAAEFMGPGRAFVLLADGAVWGVNENLDANGVMRWRCTIFRNESRVLSSTLIKEATARTIEYWVRRFKKLPDQPLTTEVNSERVRPKRDPGYCFLMAGWVHHATTQRGLTVLRAP